MFLHAWKIEFDYQGRHFELTAPLSEAWPSETEAAALEAFVNTD